MFGKVKRKLICVDLDGTLTTGEFDGVNEPIPNKEMIDYVEKLYEMGAHIIIYTARRISHYPETHAWLVKNKVTFHGIALNIKPSADIYIDDKSYRPSEVLSKVLKGE